MINRLAHAGMDALMCVTMNAAQWRLRHHAVTRERLDAYLSECEGHDHRSYYALPENPVWRRDGNRLSWNSPLQGPHGENNTARALLHDAPDSSGAPTLIMLHALMSANDLGYRRIAARFNRRGWNVLFPHLPYHYSRRPKGYANGALTVTSDLVRNAETLRQSVIELRQLIAWARQRSSKRIAVLATSYGGWVAALTLSLEEIDFAVLLQPVADVGYATFESPASKVMSTLLNRNGIYRDEIERHAHLSSPPRQRPLTNPERITVIGGYYDRISPSRSLASLCESWGGARYREVKQGHFGYTAMRSALSEADFYLENPIHDVRIPVNKAN
jgi:pimeloyl-ACP methyl ester carboxylesterase